MGGIYGGKDIRPISQKQDSLHGLINTILDKLPLGVFVKDAEDGFRYLYWNRFMEEITQHIDCQIINSGNSGCSQLHLAYVT